jgi:glycosyltransferase involved in cell wall biosynthesis
MGSFFYFSGLPECIREFAKLSEVDSHLKLLLIGGGEQDKELRELVVALGLTENVMFTGFVPYSELPRYLKLSSVAINPLKTSQVAAVAFPHKVLQYLASGLTVVSTRLDGLVSAIDGVAGLHWEASPEACMEKAVWLIRNEGSFKQPESVQAKLSELFAPEAALSSLTKTLQMAVEASSGK